MHSQSIMREQKKSNISNVNLSDLPKVNLQHISRFLSDREKYQFSELSKDFYRAVRTMPTSHFQMKEINGIRVKKIIYDELTKQRVQYVYDDFYGDEERPMYYLSLTDDPNKNGHKILHFSHFIYENPSLICAMMEDKGFRRLLENTYPAQTLLKPKVSLLTKIRNSLILGSLGLLSAILACAFLLPVAVAFGAIGLLSMGTFLMCEYPLRPRMAGLAALISPVLIVYSTIAAISIGFNTPLSWVNTKKFFANSFTLMYDWCFSPYNYRSFNPENTWGKSWLATQEKSFADIAKDYRENKLKKAEKIILHNHHSETEAKKSSQATIIARSLKVDCSRVISNEGEKNHLITYDSLVTSGDALLPHAERLQNEGSVESSMTFDFFQ